MEYAAQLLFGTPDAFISHIEEGNVDISHMTLFVMGNIMFLLEHMAFLMELIFKMIIYHPLLKLRIKIIFKKERNRERENVFNICI